MGWLSSAGDLIAHRGPDDCGMWIAPDTEVLVQGLVRRVSGETNPDYLARPCSSGCGSRSTSCGFRAAIALFLYHYLVLGAWRAGWVGYAWSRLRTDVYRLWEYKL